MSAWCRGQGPRVWSSPWAHARPATQRVSSPRAGSRHRDGPDHQIAHGVEEHPRKGNRGAPHKEIRAAIFPKLTEEAGRRSSRGETVSSKDSPALCFTTKQNITIVEQPIRQRPSWLLPSQGWHTTGTTPLGEIQANRRSAVLPLLNCTHGVRLHGCHHGGQSGLRGGRHRKGGGCARHQ